MITPADSALLGKLKAKLPCVLAAIACSNLGDYVCLRAIVQSPVMAPLDTNNQFTQLFSRFYRLRLSGMSQAQFFQMLQRRRQSSNLNYAEILCELFNASGRLQMSFASKLIAVLDDHRATYDVEIGRNMRIYRPATSLTPKQRIQIASSQYSQLEARIDCMIKSPAFANIRRAFDARFPAYFSLSDEKVLDVLTWQLRKC